jgi:sec-independent protein translocase protein TatA
LDSIKKEGGLIVGILQPTHLILILIIALIVFGPGKLPDAGKAFGKMIQEFRQASHEEPEDKDTK